MKCKGCLFLTDNPIRSYIDRPTMATAYCDYWHTYLVEKNDKAYLCDKVSTYKNSCDNCAAYEDKMEVKVVSKNW